MKKKIILGAFIVVIIGAIWYLQSMKAGPAGGSAGGPGNAASVTLPTASTTAAEAALSASGTPAKPSVSLASVAAADKAAGDQPAIELADPTGFINVPDGFTLSSIVGKKVILVDFWTYSCINCLRTLPYLTGWYSKYQNEGLTIVGVHTPEFEFEKVYDNVKAATVKYGIAYPVVMDSDYGTWQAYGNLYWPHEYLIDIAGYIVHDHIGEGGYNGTEALIQKLLAQRAQVLGMPLAPAGTSTMPAAADLSGVASPETYFGSARNEYLANGKQSKVGDQSLAAPSDLSKVQLNALYLGGGWNFSDQYATNDAAGAKIIYKYQAGNVYIVASAPNGATMEVLQDGQPITAAAAGSDVHDGKVNIRESRLYQLVANPDGAGEHTLELIIDGPGMQAYTFTFG